MSNQLILYWNIASQPARAVKALLQIGKVPHEQVVMDMGKMIAGNPDTDFLRSLNPLGQIPTLKDGDLVLGESGAIMIYLSEKFPDLIPVSFYPSDLVKRTKINQYISWYQSSFRPAFMEIIKLKIYGKKHKNQLFTPEQILYADERMEDNLKKLEQILTTNGHYIAGEAVTIVDLLVYFELTNYLVYNKKWEQHKQVNEWFKRMYSIPEVKQITHNWFSGVQALKEQLSSIKPNQMISTKL